MFWVEMKSLQIPRFGISVRTGVGPGHSVELDFGTKHTITAQYAAILYDPARYLPYLTF